MIWTVEVDVGWHRGINVEGAAAEYLGSYYFVARISFPLIATFSRAFELVWEICTEAVLEDDCAVEAKYLFLELLRPNG